MAQPKLNSRRFIRLFLSFALCALIACTIKKSDEESHLMTFHQSLEDDVKTLDPANSYDVVSLDVAPNIFETLYQYQYLSETYKLEPLLASKMPTLSKDGLTVTIPIKKGVYFQDDPCFKQSGGKGRELKAQDFVYAFKRLALPGIQSQGWWIFDGKIVGINEFHDLLDKSPRSETHKIMSQKIEGIQALDDYTLQLKLVKRYPQLLYILAMNFTAPVAIESVAAYADEQGNIPDHPIGTGPFVLKDWQRGHEIVLEKNPNYRDDIFPKNGDEKYRKEGLLADAGKKLPFLDRVVLTIQRERQPAWLSFLTGKDDLFKRLEKDNFAQAIVNRVNVSPELAAKGIRLYIEGGNSFYYISFNSKDKILGQNKLLRQALSSAIDREQWIEVFTSGSGQKMVHALNPGLPDRPKNAKIKYDYNLARAKELLKAAGYPDGKGLPKLKFDLRRADSIHRQLGEFFTKQWSAIGVEVEAIPNTFPAYLEKAKQSNLQLAQGGWTLDYPDAENIYQILYGPNQSPGPNEANFNHPEFNQLYDKMATMDPGAPRASLILKIEEIINEEIPWAYGYYVNDYRLAQPWLLNYRATEMIPGKYKYLRINLDIKKRYLEANQKSG